MQLPRDPRWLQIASLATLLVYGVLALDLEVRLGPAVVIVASCLAFQWLGTRLAGLPRHDPKSALISALSLALLLRTASPFWLLSVPLLTIGSKFVIRVRGRHVFNPTNVGLAAGMLLSDGVWVSPGQWGSIAITAFAAVCLGSVVVRRAERSDVTWAFLAAWPGLLFVRALWLGDPLTIPLHQVMNGALLIFAFFMISDPKTTPDSRAGRILFACLVAGVAYGLRFVLFDSNALIWALAACSPLVPLINLVLRGQRYEWPGAVPTKTAATPGRVVAAGVGPSMTLTGGAP
ncbi:MAG: RnfABCDGE type electron transport complex subunit D [Thermoanaerobaculia bacterium]